MEFTNRHELTAHGRRELRADAVRIATVALNAVDPVAALRGLLRREGDVLHVGDQSFALAGRRVFVVGAGKATIGMAAVLDELIGERLADAAVVVKQGQGRPLRHIEVIEAAHPVPDEASLRGGLRLLGIAEQAQPADIVIAVVTGGSSSLAVAPATGISFADTVQANRVLLASGADIISINDVRKHLSRIKGGRLAQACGCTIVNLSVSDVIGDPPDYFTDLTVADRSTFAMAHAACDRWQLWERLPAAVARHLRAADPGDETPKTIDDVHTFVVADSAIMCAAAARAAREMGYAAEVLDLCIDGEAAAAGEWLARRLAAASPGTVFVAGGENTVVLPAASGRSDDRGGPSQEAALAAAAALRGDGPACVLCIDSDGTDGPTDAAGGLVDDLSADAYEGVGGVAGEGSGLTAALARHTAYDALASMGDLVFTGPTGTNVNDLKIALKQ